MRQSSESIDIDRADECYDRELPKILWLKRNMPADLFSSCMFFDLPDFLTYRATVNLARSNCSLACKCSYVPPEIPESRGWDAELFDKIGLSGLVSFMNHYPGGFRLGKLNDFLMDINLTSGSPPSFSCPSSLSPSAQSTNSCVPCAFSERMQVKDDFAALGGQPGKSGGLILTAGQPIGKGLSKAAAQELGLNEGTAVGSGVIDAYAGWIGTVAAPMPDLGQKTVDLKESRHRLAAIAGTSTCHIVQSPESVFVPGVWGPYLHAVFPDCKRPHSFAGKSPVLNEGCIRS